MPIKLPELDDRTFADLVEEAQALIPVYAPEWTNHNESDPGITLVELFAYLAEMLIYRLNRITDENVCAFLRLVDGVERRPSKQRRGMITRGDPPVEVALSDEVRAVVVELRRQDRAVTCDDFERLALMANPQIQRASCVPQRDLTLDKLSDRSQRADAHVSVVIVPRELPFDGIWSFDGKTFTDLTASLGEGGQPAPLLPPAAGAGALLYLGAGAVFESIRFSLSEPGAGYALTFNYFDGNQNAWVELTNKDRGLTDTTSGWTTSGFVTFTAPPGWTPAPVNDSRKYWLRISTSKIPTKTATANRIVLDLTGMVAQYLEPRRLLATRLHVVGPRFVTLSVHLSLFLKPDAVKETVDRAVREKLAQFFSPFGDDQGHAGWPFGRNVYVSEIYRLLDPIPGVDFVTGLTGKQVDIVAAHDVEGERRVPPAGALVAIRLYPDEVVRLSLEKSEIVLVSPIEQGA